jgi:hypothetical protein
MLNTFSRPLPWILLVLSCSVIKAVDLNLNIGKFPYEAYRAAPPHSAALRVSVPPPVIGAAVTYVYRDKHSTLNQYVPSGWMGDYEDLQLSDSVSVNPAAGTSCMKITYQPKGRQGFDWAGMYWQHPANNWGGVAGGYDLQRMHRITFWARGEYGGEVVSVFKIGGLQGNYADTDEAQIGPVTLTSEWKQYTIDLTGMNLSLIGGGFAWATGRNDNPGPITFYLDEIRYES